MRNLTLIVQCSECMLTLDDLVQIARTCREIQQYVQTHWERLSYLRIASGFRQFIPRFEKLLVECTGMDSTTSIATLRWPPRKAIRPKTKNPKHPTNQFLHALESMCPSYFVVHHDGLNETARCYTPPRYSHVAIDMPDGTVRTVSFMPMHSLESEFFMVVVATNSVRQDWIAFRCCSLLQTASEVVCSSHDVLTEHTNIACSQDIALDAPPEWMLEDAHKSMHGLLTIERDESILYQLDDRARRVKVRDATPQLHATLRRCLDVSGKAHDDRLAFQQHLVKAIEGIHKYGYAIVGTFLNFFTLVG